MTLNLWLELGMMTLMLTLLMAHYGYLGAPNPDWTQMPNPFTPEFQIKMFEAFLMAIICWPIMLPYLLALLVKKK